jgi:hypothetical protein
MSSDLLPRVGHPGRVGDEALPGPAAPNRPSDLLAPIGGFS